MSEEDKRELPAFLYKYRAFDRGDVTRAPYSRDRQMVVDHGLWAGSPLGFNDPFDCLPSVDTFGTDTEKRRWAQRFVKKRSEQVNRKNR